MMFDMHTHKLRTGAIVDIDPVADRTVEPVAPYIYSVGIHPWRAGEVDSDALERLRELAASPRVVAIGETGLDTLNLAGSEADEVLSRQIELLKAHVELSEKLRKPLILHVVRRFNEIVRLKMELRPSQPWIIHGFRGKPQLAEQLIKHGFYLSYGERFNAASVAATPSSRLLIETDESDLGVGEIAALVGISVETEAMKRIALQSGELGALDGGMAEKG